MKLGCVERTAESETEECRGEMMAGLINKYDAGEEGHDFGFQPISLRRQVRDAPV